MNNELVRFHCVDIVTSNINYIFRCTMQIIKLSLFSFPRNVCVSRAVAGLCIGVLGTAVQVYLVETAHQSVRGPVTCLTDLYVSLGLLLSYGLGAVGLGWRWAALTLGLGPTLPLILSLTFFPDSPRYLAVKGRENEARKALQFLRGSSCDITQELDTILQAASSASQATPYEQLVSLRRPEVYMPFVTSCGVYILSQLAGPYTIYSYSVVIFQEAGIGLSPYIAAVVVGMTRLLGACVGVVVVEKAGRRPSMMVGGLGEALSLLALGLYFLAKDLDASSATTSLVWLPLVSLMCYTIFLGATTSPIPFLLATELLPLSCRYLTVFYLITQQ